LYITITYNGKKEILIAENIIHVSEYEHHKFEENAIRKTAIETKQGVYYSEETVSEIQDKLDKINYMYDITDALNIISENTRRL